MESNELKAEPGIPVVRLSASSIQMFAEAHGFATDSVDTEAWKLIWEDVNYRIRQVANLAQKMQYHSRRRQLTTEHMNKAARIFKLQPSRGQEHWDAPKLHYIKELQIYARHEGNVDLVSLALAPVNQPKDAGFKLQVSEHVPKIEGLKLEDVKPEVKTDKDTNVDALIEMIVTGLVSQQNTGLFKSVTSFLLSEKSRNFVKPLLNFLMSQVQSPKCRPSFWLPILCKTVKLLVLNRDVERELGKFANSIGKLCLESIYLVPLDETWDGTFILDVGNTLNVLNRSYPKLVFCDSESICDHLMKILKDENFDPFLHSAALACLLNFDHAIFMQIGLVDLLKFHYEINKPVFESTNYFERNQQNNSIARAVYVGMWKKVVEKQIRNLSLICTHLAAFPSVNSTWLQLGNLSGLSKMLHDMYALAYEMFGSCFIVYDCNMVTNIPVTYCQNVGEQRTEGEEMVGIKKHLMDEIEEEAFTGSIRSLLGQETDEIMRETPPLTPKGKSMQATSATKRKPSSSSTGASKKRKRKTAEGAFESPRGSRFKMRRTDFIFVFHATEAKVLLSGPKPVTAVSDTPIDVAAWHNWLRQLRIGNKTGKIVIPKSSPNCFQAPLHLNSVIL